MICEKNHQHKRWRLRGAQTVFDGQNDQIVVRRCIDCELNYILYRETIDLDVSLRDQMAFE